MFTPTRPLPLRLRRSGDEGQVWVTHRKCFCHLCVTHHLEPHAEVVWVRSRVCLRKKVNILVSFPSILSPKGRAPVAVPSSTAVVRSEGEGREGAVLDGVGVCIPSQPRGVLGVKGLMCGMALTSLAPPIQASPRGLWGMPCRTGVGALNASAASHLVGGNTQQRMSVPSLSEDFVRHLHEAVILTLGFTRFSVSEPLKISPPRKRERNSCAIPLLVHQVSVPHGCRIV